MFSENLIKKWHLVQTMIQLIILLFFFLSIFFQKNFAKNGGALLGIVFLVLLVFLQLKLLNKTIDTTNKKSQFKYYFQVINIILSLAITLWIGTSLYIKVLGTKYLGIWLVIATVYPMIMYFPMAKLALAKINSPIGQIIMLILFFGFAVPTPSFILDPIPKQILKSYQALVYLNGSNLSGAISFVITTFLVMQEWGFKAPDFKISKKVSSYVLCFLIAFILWDCCFNAFNYASSWKQFLTSWDFHLSGHRAFLYTLIGITAGLAEEWLIRFCILSILLNLLKRYKQQILWAVFLSSAIFGFCHIINIAAQSWSATLQQILLAISAGLVFATIYLYTDSLLISMIYHAAFDALAFLASGSTTMSSPTAYDWQVSILLSVLYIFVAGFLITGKRKNVVRYNLAQKGLLRAY